MAADYSGHTTGQLRGARTSQLAQLNVQRGIMAAQPAPAGIAAFNANPTLVAARAAKRLVNDEVVAIDSEWLSRADPGDVGTPSDRSDYMGQIRV